MKRCLLTLIVVLSVEAVTAQNAKIDSLKRKIQTSHDSIKARLYSQLAWEFRFGTPVKALDYVNQGLGYISESKSPKWEIELLKIKGIAYTSAAKYDEAINILKSAIDKSIQYHDLISQSECEKKLGNAYYFKGSYSKCLDAYFDALKTSEKLKAHRNVAVLKMNIGNVYYELKSWDQAMEYYQQSLTKLKTTGGSLEDQANAMHNIALTYTEIEDIDKALEYYHQVVKVFSQLKLQNNLGITYNSMGLLYTKMEAYDRAKVYFDKSIFHYEQGKSRVGPIGTNTNLAKMYLQIGDYPSTLHYAKKAYAPADSLGMVKEMYNLKEVLITAYQQTEDFKNAFDLQLQKELLRDSLYGIELDKHMSELETKYETEKKEQEIAILNKDLTIKAHQGQQQRLYIILLLLGVFVLSISIIFLIRYINYKKRLSQLERAKSTAEKKAKEEENLRLKEEVANKNRELVSIAMNVSDKNKILNDVLDHLKEVRSDSTKKIKSIIKDSMSLEDDWKNLQKHFNEVHPDYFATINQQHPKMTPLELKHCAYLKINLSIKEIARILNISHKSVQMIHYRMKKKMNLPTELSLSEYLQSL